MQISLCLEQASDERKCFNNTLRWCVILPVLFKQLSILVGMLQHWSGVRNEAVTPGIKFSLVNSLDMREYLMITFLTSHQNHMMLPLI